MKSILRLLILVALMPVSCDRCDDDKDDDPKPGTGTGPSALNGRWEYSSEIESSCPDLVGTTYELKDGTATTLTVPNNIFGWKAGENVLTNMAQTTSPTNFTANGYSRRSGGSVADPNIIVKLVTNPTYQSMTVTYTNVCNPVVVWTKKN